MKIGFVGLGRMGFNMVLNLMDHKHKVVAYNRSKDPVKKIAKKGAIPAFSVEEMFNELPKRKVIFIMVTAGKPVDAVIKSLLPYLKKGDIVVDSGNSFFKDSQRRYKKLKKKGMHFLDCGTSGGIEGARNGACMMVGGDKKIFKYTEKLFKDMCVKDGYGYMGKPGAGHFVKMVHNAIEYGMLGAIAEGMEVNKKNEKKLKLDMSEISKVYAHGSIIESRLMSWTDDIVKQKKLLKQLSGKVPKGETEEEMILLEKMTGKMPILHQAHTVRERTRVKKTYGGKIVAGVRFLFGGHKFNKK